MSDQYKDLPQTSSGGVTSINGDTTAAQVITGGTGISVATSAGTTTITNTLPASASAITGTGTANFFPIFTGAQVIANSLWKQGSNGEYQFQNYASAKGTRTAPLIDFDPGSGTPAGLFTDVSDNLIVAAFGRQSFLIEPGGYTLYDGSTGTSVKMRTTISGYRTRVVGSGGVSGGPSLLEWAGDTTNGQGTSAIQISNAAGTLLALMSCDISTDVFTISGKSSAAMAIGASGTVDSTKRLTAGVFALTDGATPALDASLGNLFTLITTTNPTIAVPTNPVDGHKIELRVTASGGSRTLALNTGAGGFHFGSDITALTAIASGKTDRVSAEYDAVNTRWDVVGYLKGF